MNKNNPIGVFDSGIGGLTIVKELMKLLPNENIIYFGDLGRLPYGNKSVETINKFSSQTVQFLLKQNVKAIIIACNTISAVAKDTVKTLASSIPVINIVDSGAKLAIDTTENNKIGVIATLATIKSNAYPKALYSLSNNVEVFVKACPLFVPMIEEGFINHPALEIIAKEYLQYFNNSNIDTLILGCTHYPLIKKTIEKIINNNIKVVDPATYACENLKKTLEDASLLKINNHSFVKYFVTDIPINFKQTGEQFLNKHIDDINLVHLD